MSTWPAKSISRQILKTALVREGWACWYVLRYGKENGMPAAVTSKELYEFGGRTEMADWVLADSRLSAQAIALYTRICFQAQQAACGGKRLTLDRDWANWASGGDGAAALTELLTVRALTRVAAYKGGKVRFQTESYPPFIQDLRAGRLSRREVPELNAA